MFNFAKRPDSSLLEITFRAYDTSYAVLHSIDPLAAIFAPVRVRVYSFTVLLIESVMALVFAAILPDVVTEAMHDTGLEAASEEAAIGPLEAAFAAHFITRPTACVL